MKFWIQERQEFAPEFTFLPDDSGMTKILRSDCAFLFLHVSIVLPNIHMVCVLLSLKKSLDFISASTVASLLSYYEQVWRRVELCTALQI